MELELRAPFSGSLTVDIRQINFGNMPFTVVSHHLTHFTLSTVEVTFEPYNVKLNLVA